MFICSALHQIKYALSALHIINWHVVGSSSASTLLLKNSFKFLVSLKYSKVYISTLSVWTKYF